MDKFEDAPKFDINAEFAAEAARLAIFPAEEEGETPPVARYELEAKTVEAFHDSRFGESVITLISPTLENIMGDDDQERSVTHHGVWVIESDDDEVWFNDRYIVKTASGREEDRQHMREGLSRDSHYAAIREARNNSIIPIEFKNPIDRHEFPYSVEEHMFLMGVVKSIDPEQTRPQPIPGIPYGL